MEKPLVVYRAQIQFDTAAAADTDAGYMGVAAFPGSKMLLSKSNMNTNRGIVHKIWAIEYIFKWDSSGNDTNLVIAVRAQLIRRALAVFAAGATVEKTISDHPDTIAHETGLFGSRVTNSGGPPASDADTKFSKYFLLPFPLYMVRPYFITAFQDVLGTLAQVRNLFMECYVYVEEVEMKGEEYRRLLDAYTQVPVLKELREFSGDPANPPNPPP